jgi:hypothetical protein
MRRLQLLPITLLLSICCLSKTAISAPLPQWFTSAFEQSGLEKKYDLMHFLHPSFLEADFNGDSSVDIAVLIQERSTKRKGVLIMHGSTNQYFILGAGKDFGNGSDNFGTWLNHWALWKKKTAEETVVDEKTSDLRSSKRVRLLRPALLIDQQQDGGLLAGGIIYWDGKKYIWIQQGE